MGSSHLYDIAHSIIFTENKPCSVKWLSLYAKKHVDEVETFLQHFAEKHSDEVLTLMTVFGRVKQEGLSKMQILLIEKSQFEDAKHDFVSISSSKIFCVGPKCMERRLDILEEQIAELNYQILQKTLKENRATKDKYPLDLSLSRIRGRLGKRKPAIKLTEESVNPKPKPKKKNKNQDEPPIKRLKAPSKEILRKQRLEAESNPDNPAPKPVVKSREQRKIEEIQRKRAAREARQAEKKAKAGFKKNPLKALWQAAVNKQKAAGGEEKVPAKKIYIGPKKSKQMKLDSMIKEANHENAGVEIDHNPEAPPNPPKKRKLNPFHALDPPKKKKKIGDLVLEHEMSKEDAEVNGFILAPQMNLKGELAMAWVKKQQIPTQEIVKESDVNTIQKKKIQEDPGKPPTKPFKKPKKPFKSKLSKRKRKRAKQQTMESFFAKKKT